MHPAWSCAGIRPALGKVRLEKQPITTTERPIAFLACADIVIEGFSVKGVVLLESGH